MKKRLSIAIAGALLSQPVLAADMSKVLRVAFPAPETGFDPAKVSDVYSSSITENVFDPMLTYDFMARPSKLIPNTLAEMPKVSEDGKVLTFHLKKGIYFAPDPVFKGQTRELTAADYVYSLKRLVDPTTGSPTGYLIAGKFIGLDEWVKTAKNGKLNYDVTVEGIKTLDRYTLQLTLKDAYPALQYVLAMPHLGAVAREVIEAYADNTMSHPVGTGPYMVSEWKPGTHISLVANPNYRKKIIAYKAGDDIGDQQLAKEMNGKTIPEVGRIEISIIQEEQPRWLAFRNGDLDLSSMPQPLVRGSMLLDPSDPWRVDLKPDLKKRGIKLHRDLAEEITYYVFNMKDPVLGGLGKEKIALRRAIAMSFNTTDTIRNIRRNQAVKAQYIIPPNVAGHNPNFRAAFEYNPALANALLDEFGYKLGVDGKRDLPDGKPLVVDFITGTTGIDKQWNEYWQKAFDLIKVKVAFRQMQWNEQVKSLRTCTYGMDGAAWLADYPDGDNFTMMLYGKNIGSENYACYSSPKYDKLYEASQKMVDSPERNALYDQMNKVMMADTPWVMADTRFNNYLTHAWIKGYKPHPQFNTLWRYLDIQK
ncbi:ABC transporter substrate-binding protein [Iodobacter fluviatilis]|uniref:ABC transporter substrate-binding protein n=1 Tax=Iodobacter fluviatilis TaxID=537 RepID=A0A7G3GD16_9NEIS|nr:ABC transporter substrate-binding protein [Iodobacter fluviatilis]QBC44942.1 ABC transporter substrate-binding protein [Iodobacter fluviatilis]